MRAGVVALTSTQRDRVISPATTPWYVQVDPVLDPRHAVGDLGEVPGPELLLLLEAERAVVGRDHREVVGAQPPPQVGLVLPGAQRRRAHELRPFEALAGPGRRPTGTGTAGRSRRTRSGPGRAPRPRPRGHPWWTGGRCRAAPRPPWPGRWRAWSPRPRARRGRVAPWNSGVGLPPGQGLGDQHVDGDPVLGVHHHRRPRWPGPAAWPAGSRRRSSRRRPGRP